MGTAHMHAIGAFASERSIWCRLPFRCGAQRLQLDRPGEWDRHHRYLAQCVPFLASCGYAVYDVYAVYDRRERERERDFAITRITHGCGYSQPFAVRWGLSASLPSGFAAAALGANVTITDQVHVAQPWGGGVTCPGARCSVATRIQHRSSRRARLLSAVFSVCVYHQGPPLFNDYCVFVG